MLHSLFKVSLHHWLLISTHRSALPTTAPVRDVTGQLTSHRYVSCEQKITTYTHRNNYLCGEHCLTGNYHITDNLHKIMCTISQNNENLRRFFRA